MNISMYADYPQGFGLPKFREIPLTVIFDSVYSGLAVAKSTAGIETPFYYSAHGRQLVIAGFFMRKICAHLSNALRILRLNYGGLDEAAKAGRFRVCGSLNLVQFITSQRLRPLGDGLKPYSEAVIMTTTPTQAVTTAMIYTFLIAGGVRALSDFKRIRTISLLAQSERSAREQLNGLPLVFVSRTPNCSTEVAA
jgi:hypothetical protein